MDPTLERTRQIEALRSERNRLRSALAETEQERDDALLHLEAMRLEAEQLRRELSNGSQSADRLRTERDALSNEVERLRAILETLGAPPALPPTETPAPGLTARVSLPAFDLTRLVNGSEIQARLEATVYPDWALESRLGGDLLVLFQTDESGAVVRTAVPRPLGGGLDAMAEEIVRSMRFVPVRVNGRSTGLRSQVVVRFQP